MQLDRLSLQNTNSFVPPSIPGATQKPQPASPIKLPVTTVRRGDRSEGVRNLQLGLVQLGHLAKATMDAAPGTFGPATETALKSFQKKWGLPEDGVFGPKTRAAMERALAGDPAPGTEVKKPNVTWAASPNHDDRNGTDIDTIVLHHTASNDGKKDLNTLRNPASKVSAHYMVDRDGTIYQLVADGRRSWHAGKSALHGVHTDVNARSIGIEIVNAGDGKTPFTEAQYKALEQLVPYLAKTYEVPLSNLVGHKDVAIPPGRKHDPAKNFDFARIRTATDRVV